MAQYVTFEGTQDYLIHFPALIMTFVASGSITAGNAVGMGTDGKVFAMGNTAAAEHVQRVAEFIGISTKTVSNTNKVPVIVWGPVKNIVAQVTINPGQYIVPSGSAGRFGPMSVQAIEHPLYTTTGYSGSLNAGRAISTAAAAGTFRAIIKGF